jgi:hypothetical protein
MAVDMVYRKGYEYGMQWGTFNLDDYRNEFEMGNLTNLPEDEKSKEGEFSFEFSIEDVDDEELDDGLLFDDDFSDGEEDEDDEDDEFDTDEELEYA